MGQSMGITPNKVQDRLRILHLAGQENPKVRIQQASAGSDIVICDPLYALCNGGETIEDLREPLRWLRRLAVQRVAVLFVHHDAKGTPGDRDTRDRGSGSGNPLSRRSRDGRDK
jgi:RecA-family ATPase